MLRQLFFSSKIPYSELKNQITVYICGFEHLPGSSNKDRINKILKNEVNDRLLNPVWHYFSPKVESTNVYVPIPHDGQFIQHMNELMIGNRNHIVFFVFYHRIWEHSFTAAKDYVEAIKNLKIIRDPFILLIATGEGALRKKRPDLCDKGQLFAEENNIVHAAFPPIQDIEYDSGIYKMLNSYREELIKLARGR